MAGNGDKIRGEMKSSEEGIDETRSAITQKVMLLKQRARETIGSVTQMFDVRYHVNRRPWLMLSGSLLAGFMLGRRSRRVAASKLPFSREVQQSNYVDGDRTTVKGAVLAAVTNLMWEKAKRLLWPSAPRRITQAKNRYQTAGAGEK
jgi:hypothetical protein